MTQTLEHRIDPATGEDLDYTRATGQYIVPTEEQFETHDVPLRGAALVPVRNVKELILKKIDGSDRTKEERITAARQLTKYMDGPSELADKFTNQKLTLVGAFEFILSPFEKEHPKTGEKFMEHNAKSQKVHVIDGKGSHHMLRFGAESTGNFIAKWTAAYRDFDWPEGKSVKVIIRTEGRRYTFEEVE